MVCGPRLSAYQSHIHPGINSKQYFQLIISYFIYPLQDRFILA